MIQPGLERTARLLGPSMPWRAIHVAGTNGKGSVCAYVSGMLEAYNRTRYRLRTGGLLLRHGRFTSPHLVRPSDSIYLSSLPSQASWKVRKRKTPGAAFRSIRVLVDKLDVSGDVGASEFERTTAAAFDLFSYSKVDLAVIEVGLGGRLDATNVLGQPAVLVNGKPAPEGVRRPPPLVSAITKIGLDHQEFLGSTLPEVAAEKAGIIRSGVPLVGDSSQDASAQAVISQTVQDLSSEEVQLDAILPLIELRDLDLLKRRLPSAELQSAIMKHLYKDSPSAEVEEKLASMLASRDAAEGYEAPDHVKQNTSIAFRATWTALHRLGRLPMLGMEAEAAAAPENYETAQEDLTTLAEEMLRVPENTVFPGRQQRLVIRTGKHTTQEALLDGAHNAQSAEVLGIAVDKLRAKDLTKNPDRKGAVTYLLAASNTKDVATILKPLLKPGDSVFAVAFGPVEEMPWVKAMAPSAILQAAGETVGDAGTLHLEDCGDDILQAVAKACKRADGGTLVVAGSLYLVGQVLAKCEGGCDGYLD